MIKRIKSLLLVGLVMLSVVCGVGIVFAEDNLSVSVNAILPDNQRDKSNTFYDLRVNPGQKQELDFELNNTSDKEQKVLLQINNATTNDTGAIDYSDRGGKVDRDSSLKLALTDIAKVDKEVTVKAKSKKVVKIKLSVPEETFKGEVLGGIRVMSPDEETGEDEENGGGMQIKNKVAYTVGISLTEADDPIEAELDLLSVEAGQTAGRNVIKANVQNSRETILEDIKYSSEVSKKGKSEVLYKSTAEKYRFAPNSNFDFDVSLNSQPFVAGDYTMNMTAESVETGQKWKWKKDFKIDADTAKKLNESAIDLDKDNKMLYIIVGLVAVIILILLIILFVVLKKKKEEKRRKELKKKRKSSKNKSRNSKSKKKSKK